MDRFNYTQSFGDLGACSDLESIKESLSTVIDALERNGISPPPVNASVAAQQDADGNFKYPSSEPPRPWFRFKLTDVFTDGVAPAVVIDSATSELTPGEQVAVTDALGFYSSGAADDLGYAMVAESTIPGKMQNEVWIMPGVGVPTGTDNYTVKLEDAADDAEFMEAKFEHLDGATYDAGTHQFVYSTVVGSGTSRLLRLFTAIGAGGADTDKYVSVDSTDTAGYLIDKFVDATGATYDPAAHFPVYFNAVGDPGARYVSAYVDRSQESGKTRVSSGDSLAYLQNQFGYSATEPGSGATPVYADGTNGSTIDNFITWRDTGTYDSTTHALVYEQNASDGGFTKARLFTPLKRTWWGVVGVSGITALTGTIGGPLTPGSGTVQIYSKAGTIDSGVTKTFYNWMPVAIEYGTTVMGDEEPDGQIWVRVAPCDPLEAP